MERKVYAKTLDIHIYGEDCPYECKEYEHWRQFQKELNGNSIDIIVRCKECIYYSSEPDSKGDHCDKIHWSRGTDWFCADGKRKGNE
jgi:hypothetical protein